MKFVKPHDKLVETNINDIFFARYPEERFKKWFVDNSNKRFERLRKKIKVLDDKGNEYMAKTMMIHFDENDIETKDAIRKGDITKEEVAYGKFIVDAFKNQMILNLEHEIISKRNYNFLNERTEEGKAEIRKRAEEEYNKLWVDGMMPIMHKSVSAKLFSGDIKGGTKKLMKQLQNANALLDETPKSPEEQDDIVNKFMFQLGSEIDTENKSNAKNNIGNLGNASKLGITYNPYSKEWTMLDSNRNEDISDDFDQLLEQGWLPWDNIWFQARSVRYKLSEMNFHKKTKKLSKKIRYEIGQLTEEEVEQQLPKPVGYMVMVALPKVEESYESGIIKSDQSRREEYIMSTMGAVIDMGAEAYCDKDRFPNGPWCKEGDFILTRPMAGSRVKIHGREFRLINDDSVEAVVEDPRGISRA